jgi:hypothetical protein
VGLISRFPGAINPGNNLDMLDGLWIDYYYIFIENLWNICKGMTINTIIERISDHFLASADSQYMKTGQKSCINIII